MEKKHNKGQQFHGFHVESIEEDKMQQEEQFKVLKEAKVRAKNKERKRHPVGGKGL